MTLPQRADFVSRLTEQPGPISSFPLANLPRCVNSWIAAESLYWVEEDAISLDGAPEEAVIDLGRRANAVAVPVILDSV